MPADQMDGTFENPNASDLTPQESEESKKQALQEEIDSLRDQIARKQAEIDVQRGSGQSAAGEEESKQRSSEFETQLH